MKAIVQLYRLVNILSLDIVIGAVACALFFGKLLHVRILPYGLAALALTVWIIYTADHLRDSMVIRGKASSTRHQFHQKHFRLLFAVMCVAISIDAVMILFTKKPVLTGGFILAIIVAVYLFIQRYLKVLKEIFIAALYTCGVLLPSISITTVKLNSFHILLITQFFFTALMNLLIFSWFDQEKDKVDEQHSFATILGRKPTALCVYFFATINFAITLFLLTTGFDRAQIVTVALMYMLLTAVFVYSDQNSNAYRVLGDAVFFIPGIYLLWTLS
jgi:hypothetical protein